MAYADIAAAARGHMGPFCASCPVCDGRACGNKIPGPGAKGSGTVARENREAWSRFKLNMDTFHEPFEADSAYSFFGRMLAAPIMVAPVGDVERHYGDELTMDAYNEMVTRGAVAAGTLAWTGDGVHENIYAHACECIGALKGAGVAVFKPWAPETVDAKRALAQEAGVAALAMDVDSCGLPFLKGLVPAAGPKSVGALRGIIEACGDMPFIVKGVMTPKAARACVEAGAAGIVVSNHGGRVLDGCPATADVLSAIVKAVPEGFPVFVDGGIRTGVDVFRALALGAAAALICRPFVVAVYGGGEQGVAAYFEQLASELRDCMEMCGARTLADITPEMIMEVPARR